MIASVTAGAAPAGTGLLRRAGAALRLAAAVLLALSPLGAILVLGWLTRLMADEHARARARMEGRAPPALPLLPRWIRGGALLANLRLGLATLLTLLAGTLPFGALWLFSWWGGWENSFNKGYEQAWIGPALALLGTALALPLLARLPMALAHQAATGRAGAFFALAAVRRLMGLAGWRYVAHALLTLLLAVPLFLFQAAPVFVENWHPAILDATPEDAAAFARAWRLGAAAYLVLALVLLRRNAARLHARASLRLEAGARAALPGRLLRAAALGAIWLAFAALLYLGQFLNHGWTGWVTHPFWLLPWWPMPGAGP